MALHRTPAFRAALLAATTTLAACASGHAPLVTEAPPPPPPPTPASSAAPVPPVPPVPPPRPRCEVAAELRARVPGLLAEGRLDRTVRAIVRADGLCRESAPATWEALVATLAELGRADEVLKVAETIDASADAPPAARAAAKAARETIAADKGKNFGDTAKAVMRKVYLAAAAAREHKQYEQAKKGFLAAWSLYHPNGRALWSAGIVAKERGQKAEAQRLFDRAIVDLEIETKKQLSLDTPDGLPGGVNALAWSPDGRWLAIAAGYVVSIRERLLNLRETLRFEGHRDQISSVAFSPDSKTLATSSMDRTVRIWDLATGVETQAPKVLPFGVNSVAFSGDGALLAAGTWNAVHLWDAATGAPLRGLDLPKEQVNAVAFSPDRKLVAVGSSGGLRLWRVADGAVRKLSGAAGTVNAVAFSRDGKLASGSEDGTVNVFDVATGVEARKPQKHEHWVTSVAFSRDGKTLASAGLAVGLWSLTPKGTLHVLPAKGEAGAHAVAFFPGGDIVASGAADGIVRLWNASTERQEPPIEGHSSKVWAVAISPDGKSLASGSWDRRVRLWSATAAPETRYLEGHEHPVPTVAFAPRGQLLASGSWDHTVRLWDLAGRDEPRKLDKHTDLVNAISFSPDGSTLASASSDKTVRLWNVATGVEVHPPRLHRGEVRTVFFSPDGKTIASGTFDEPLRLWNVETGAAREVDNFWSGVFSPAGALVAFRSAGNVQIWDLAAGTKKLALDGLTSMYSSAAFSPDGQTFAAGSMDGPPEHPIPVPVVKLWSVATGAVTRKLPGHTGVIKSVAFSPARPSIATASEDGTIRLWSTAGQSLLVLRALAERDASYAFTSGPSPLIELFGAEAEAAAAYPICRVGALSFPFDLCRERFEVHGLLAKALAGESFPDEP